ncbi:hypothetical protein SAMN02927921_01658 [Sinomicrobium oceani]|uniref:DUF2846 domain-containing protein n=1 Tax=Sinomicrobium oceani TaxID=1150368 RepID=A0A1K1P6P0_9FLAO|nr:hypothetical protein [Sinomicrobium oceani]SFW43432.1 hypothetical protein SAMN02927921_01658 [Sinomicrobium oceani]
MKRFVYRCSGLLLMSVLLSCAGSRKQVTARPEGLELGNVVTENWRNGAKPGSGTTIFIPVTSESDVLLDSVYYRGKGAKLEKVQRGNYLVYIGWFVHKPKQDIIMHADPKKEVGNRPPELPGPSPFELEDDEAVVSYVARGKTRYFKVSGITEEKTVVNPGRN